jgi:pimeloyl-ACP methyl ester carboxylesterase
MMVKASDGQYVEVDGLKTHYFRKGTGRPLVLVHGASPGACALVAWRPNIDRFAEAGFAVYAFDQTGFGNTDNPEDHALEYRCRHAKAFIDAMGIDEYDVVANSLGAYVAAWLALEDRRAARLVLTANGFLAPKGSAASEEQAQRHRKMLRSYTPGLETIREMTMGTLYHNELADEELVNLRYEMSAGKNYEAQMARRDAAPPASLVERVGGLSNKTLLIWGANDSGVSIEKGVATFQALPDAELHVFNHCGHWPQWDQTERFHDLVYGFLGLPAESRMSAA